MNITTGVDIIEISRIEKMLKEFEDNFKNRVYTKNEIDYCESSKVNMYQRYAVRFAAKEAVYKALNVLNNDEVNWKSIEILKDENQRPYIKLYDGLQEYMEKIEKIDVSLSHINEMAIANAVVLWK